MVVFGEFLGLASGWFGCDWSGVAYLGDLGLEFVGWYYADF